MSIDPLLIVCIALGIALLGLAYWVYILHRRITALTRGNTGSSLETVITQANERLSELEQSVSDTRHLVTQLEPRVRRSIQSVQTIRFNPFSDSGGGQQSFASALINEDGDGVVISTLYARNHVGIFAKPVQQLHAQHELSNEERDALERASRSLDS
jgi:biopolymer transport protein ExbB/TolQ